MEPEAALGEWTLWTFRMLGVLRVFGMFQGVAPNPFAAWTPGCGRRRAGARPAMVRDPSTTAPELLAAAEADSRVGRSPDCYAGRGGGHAGRSGSHGPRRAAPPRRAATLASVVGAGRGGALRLRRSRAVPDGEPVRRRAGCSRGRASPRPRPMPLWPLRTRVAEPSAASTRATSGAAASCPFSTRLDPQYRDAPYAAATVGEAGCGPTSLAMVYIALTGVDR